VVQSPAGSAASVLLSFTDNGTDETGFLVERSTDSGATWTTVTTLAANSGTGTVSYTDDTLGLSAVGRTVRYRVSAINAVASSQYASTWVWVP
jgi:hypothetical protein